MEEQYESNESPELIKKRAHASDESIFVDRDLEKRKMIEAEVQKKLTKASKFFSGRLVRNIGLRYAPDLRFHIDDSIKQMADVAATAESHLKEYHEQESKRKEEEKGKLTGIYAEMAKPFLELSAKLKIFETMTSEQ